MSKDDHRIALIGLRGSGKSCIGQVLAQRLGWTFVDADAVLEQRAGQSIRALFATEGEAGFRDRESSILAELCHLPRHVLATGGGVVLRAENRALLASQAWVVWLTADVETLSRRLNADSSTSERRPALTAAAMGAASVQEIAALLRVREPLYRECANLIVDTKDRSPEAIAAEILASLEQNRRPGFPA